jgi:hypothetical protein
MPSPTNNQIALSRELELQRILTLAQASEVSGLSVDSLKRHHASKIIALSPRRQGMRVVDALMLTPNTAA